MSCRRRRFKCSNVFAAHFFTALGIGVKQGHRLLVRLELDLVVGVIEIIAVSCFEIVEHFLVLGIEGGRQGRLHLAFGGLGRSSHDGQR